MPVPAKLLPVQLYNRCDPGQFTFSTTAELDGTTGIAGQERALDAIRLGMGIRRDGFNLFALGPAGTGKESTVRQFLNDAAAREARPDDWCYVYNFDKPRNPKALRLPPGRACELRNDMERLVETLFSVMPAAFSSEEYQSREKEIGEALQEKQSSAMDALEKDAREHEITLIRTPGGFAFAPVRDGTVIAPDDYMKLKQEERDQIEKETGRLRDSLQSIMAQFPKWQRETAEKIKELNREVSAFALKPLMDEIRVRYKEVEAVLRYLGEVEKDMIENFGQFLEKESPGEGSPPSATGST